MKGLTAQDIEKKYIACVNAIDDTKNCETCKHQNISHTSLPCSDCFNMVLGFPVNPTGWETRKER